MSDKQVSNGLKSALEFGPVALFFIAYIWLKDEVFQFDGTEYGGFIIVTAGFVPLMILSDALETDRNAVENADFYRCAGDGFWGVERLAKR